MVSVSECDGESECCVSVVVSLAVRVSVFVSVGLGVGVGVVWTMGVNVGMRAGVRESVLGRARRGGETMIFSNPKTKVAKPSSEVQKFGRSLKGVVIVLLVSFCPTKRRISRRAHVCQG